MERISKTLYGSSTKIQQWIEPKKSEKYRLKLTELAANESYNRIIESGTYCSQSNVYNISDS